MTTASPGSTHSPYPHKPWTVAFYSFRGGVGRTTLAVNTALNLSKQNLFQINAPVKPGVFLLDFDLEAPGIDEFQVLKPPSHDQAGVIEYVQAYRSHGHAPSLAEFVYPIGKKRRISVSQNSESEVKRLQVETDLYGCYVMRAGRRDVQYRQSLMRLNWETFFKFEDGHLFFDNLLAGVFKELKCDLAVVDARTGLTEIGSVCTGYLADAVVLVFQPNSAHQRGLADVVAAIRRREELENRPVPRLYVASKIGETYEGELTAEERELATETVRLCERSSECEELDVARLFDEGELSDVRPKLTFIGNRPRVKGSHRPDAYLVDTYGDPQFGPSAIEQQYAAVEVWVSSIGEAFKKEMDERRELVENQRKLVELLSGCEKSKFALQIADDGILQALRELPADMLEEFASDRHIAILKRLRETNAQQDGV